MTAVALMIAAAFVGVGPAPVLGRSFGPNQQGFGRSSPPIVYLGGDPTGEVTSIRWSGWGTATAVGTGVSTWVWPGTAVGDNRPIAGARIVAFHLGRCRGRLSYNAVEWYFPRYGDAFDPRQYVNTCTGAYVGAQPSMTRCVRNGTAFDIQVVGISCSAADRLIAGTPLRRYERSGGRFVEGEYRCGTEGDLAGAAIFECGLGARDLLFEVPVK